MRLLVIYNPWAGHGKAGRLQARVEAAFHTAGITADVRRTAHPGHGTALVREADLAGYDGIIAAGGDGTLFEVINGLFAHAGRPDLPLGVLPVGTGNAFARELELQPNQWEAALRIIQQGHTRRVDVGQYTTPDGVGHFLNILGFGFVSAANRTSRRFKALGNPAYTLAVLVEMLRLKHTPLTLRIDGQRLDHDNVFVEISNTRYTGTTFLMAPQAEVDDGLLDVTLVGPLTRRRLLRLFPTIYDGSHVDAPEVTTYRARQIDIIASESDTFSPDGELLEAPLLSVACLPRAVSVFWVDGCG